MRETFHALAIVNSAAVNIGVMYLFETEFSPDVCLGMGLLYHMVTPFLVFFFKELSYYSL